MRTGRHHLMPIWNRVECQTSICVYSFFRIFILIDLFGIDVEPVVVCFPEDGVGGFVLLHGSIISRKLSIGCLYMHARKLSPEYQTP